MIPTPEAVKVAAALCRKFEGLYLRPYMCPAGVPTVGYGSTFYENGIRVTLRDPPITQERAEELLRHELEKNCLPAVARLCPGIDDDNDRAALMDFVFNLGSGRLASSTLRKRVNAGAWAQVPAELRKWVIGGGRVLPGLVRRREAEISLMGER